MIGKDRKEGLEKTDKVIIIWHHFLGPSLDKLNQKLGFQVEEEDLVFGGRATPPFRDAVKHYETAIEEKIEKYGVPKAIVICDIQTPQVTTETASSPKPPVRKREEVIGALRRLADKYNTAFIEIDPQEIIED